MVFDAECRNQASSIAAAICAHNVTEARMEVGKEMEMAIGMGMGMGMGGLHALHPLLFMGMKANNVARNLHTI